MISGQHIDRQAFPFRLTQFLRQRLMPMRFAAVDQISCEEEHLRSLLSGIPEQGVNKFHVVNNLVPLTLIRVVRVQMEVGSHRNPKCGAFRALRCNDFRLCPGHCSGQYLQKNTEQHNGSAKPLPPALCSFFPGLGHAFSASFLSFSLRNFTLQRISYLLQFYPKSSALSITYRIQSRSQ